MLAGLVTFGPAMHNFSEIIPEFFKRHHIDSSSQFLIACSGGVDSMVLAELFFQAGLKPTIAHCNFRLRGKDADKDQDFVKHYAAERDLPFFTTNFDTKAFAEKNGISIQMAARDLRYGYFEEILRTHHLDYLCTAHHLDDSLETILLNLGRGTGLTGLTGMKPTRDNILRPLLDFTKNEIFELAKDLNLTWREDASNFKTDYQRNYLRHKVIPVFKENFPGFDKGFRNTAQQLQNDGDLFQDLLDDKIKSLVQKEGDSQKVSIAELLQVRAFPSILHHWLKAYGNFDLRGIIQSLGESGRMFASEQYELLVDRDFLILRKAQTQNQETYVINESDLVIDQPISLLLEEITADKFEISKSKHEAAFDKAKLKFPLTIRRWKEGDFFYPLGMKGKKKLSDFFIDQKLNLYEKDDAWLLLSGNDIVWVINHRIDDRYKVSYATKSVYFARLK